VTAVLIVFRAKGDDWNRFVQTLRSRYRDLEEAGCLRVEAYRNRKHPAEWLMLHEWPSKEIFDSFADRQGPDLDREAGWLRWKDVSTWAEGVAWTAGGEPRQVAAEVLEPT
jgi:hypothetical protein